MRRSRMLPIETMAAISLVVAASLLAAVVLVRDAADDGGTDRAAVVATDRSPVTTAPTDPVPPEEPATPVPAPTTTVADASAPASDDAPGAPSTSTSTTTSTLPSRPPTSRVEHRPACPGLTSDTYWTASGQPSVLDAAAGGWAQYVEVVTNGGDEPCTLDTDRCGTTAGVRTGEGAPIDAPARACTTEGAEVVLEPGEERTERLVASFPVPPGTYGVHIRRYDGTAITLPVRLDDRLPACDPAGLRLQVNGPEQVRQRSELRDDGLRVDLLVLGGSEECSVRTVESRLHLGRDGEQIDMVDAADRWLAAAGDPGDPRIFTHAVTPPGDIPAGDYEGRVTLVLEAGDRLSAPFSLTVG